MERVSHMSGPSAKELRPAFPTFDLGVAPYLPLQALQARLRVAVAEGRIPGVLLLLEHEPVITLGSRAGAQDLHAPSGIPVVRSERGGQATLHAPGQLISYPIVPIPGRDLTEYVRGLEEANILTLREFGIRGERRKGRPGVYVSGDKISSIGLRCQRWVSSHGTSLNVTVDLSLFDAIVSCGEPQLQQTSMERLIPDSTPSMAVIKDVYLRSVKQVFGWRLERLRRVPYDRVETELGLGHRIES